MFDNTEVLEEVKLLLGISDTSKDATLLLLIDHCFEDFMAYTRVKEYRESYKGVVEDMILYRFSVLKAEGINSESYTGYSVSYSLDYPQFIKNALDKIKQVKFV